MFEVFDDFLHTGTWHTHHHEDENRFYCALKLIVERPDFSAEKMRDYMAAHQSVAGEYGEEINDYVIAAETVRAFVKARC